MMAERLNLVLVDSLQAFAAYQFFLMRPSYTKQRALKKEILANKAELNATSSQDQFAKWAKLRRKLDKGLADLEKLSEPEHSSYLYHVALLTAADSRNDRRLAFFPSISVH